MTSGAKVCIISFRSSYNYEALYRTTCHKDDVWRLEASHKEYTIRLQIGYKKYCGTYLQSPPFIFLPNVNIVQKLYKLLKYEHITKFVSGPSRTY